MLTHLLIATVLASNASGKTLVRQQQGTSVPAAGSNVLAYFPFTVPGCYPSGSAMGTKGETITVTRTGNATYADASGTIQTCSDNQARVGCDPTKLTECGLLVEPARTNYALNSATHPKTSQATAALGTGAFVAWHTGTGTMTVANGTATTTGLSCSTVAAGTVCSFTVTVGGTMSITTTSGTTHVQVENGTYRTSKIATAGSAGVRNADIIQIANPLYATNPAIWCVEVTGVPESGRAWSSADSNSLWSSGAAYANPGGRALIAIASGSTLRLYSESGTASAQVAHGFGAGETHRIAAGSVAGTGAVYTDGTQRAQGAATQTQVLTTLNIGLGDSGGATAWGGFLRDFKVYRGVCK